MDGDSWRKPPGSDIFGGKAYLGGVPFFMQNIRPRFLPAVAGASVSVEQSTRWMPISMGAIHRNN
jgi:uncharacterized protein YqjF (DUF2071 family)